MSLLLVLAGCSGGGNGTATNTTANGTTTPGEQDVSYELQLEPYEFSEGESYTYNVTVTGVQSTNTWKVVSVDNGTVTVEGTQATPQGSQNTTIRGNQTTIVQVASRDSITQAFARSRSALALQGLVADASAGDTIELSESNLANPDAVQWTSATLEVGETRTVGGIDCTEATLTPNDGPTSSACINPEYPFPLTLTATQNGQVGFAMELTNATRP